VGKLRQIEVLVSQGKTVPQACKEAGIVEQTFDRWRKEYGGLQVGKPKSSRSCNGRTCSCAALSLTSPSRNRFLRTLRRETSKSRAAVRRGRKVLRRPNRQARRGSRCHPCGASPGRLAWHTLEVRAIDRCRPRTHRRSCPPMDRTWCAGDPVLPPGHLPRYSPSVHSRRVKVRYKAGSSAVERSLCAYENASRVQANAAGYSESRSILC